MSTKATWTVTQPAISLRDWFAGMAMQGLLSHPDYACSCGGEFAGAAKDAYAYADALLAQEAKG